MTATATAPSTDPDLVTRTPGEIRRARILGFVYFGLAAVVFIVFVLGTESGAEATWRLSRPTDSVTVPDLVIPVNAFAIVIAVVLAFLGAIQITRGFGKKANIFLGVGMLLFILAFLAWASAGNSFSMAGMLDATVFRAVPIALGALSGVLCERAGVINIAIEGQLLMGAFVGVVVGSLWGLWPGLIAAVLSGAILSWVLAVLSIRYLVDQIIAGFFIWIVSLGLTSFLTAQLLIPFPELNNSGTFQPIAIPLLSDIPVIGPILFDQNIFVYAMFILVGAIQYGLMRTRWGLRARSVGEKPEAADTVGINVWRTRYRNVILGGLVAGLGGAWFTLGSVGRFDENMTGGRGFIALAAMIVGRHSPVGALGAALVFGFADSLQQKLAILQTPIPSEFLLMAPYLATIIVVAGLVGRARVPAADGQPYVKE